MKPNSKYILLIFLVVFVIHFLSQTTSITDSRWTLHTTMSMLREHNTNIDEYKYVVNSNQNYAIDIIDDHYYYSFPIGTSLLILPVVKVLDFIAHRIFFMDINTLLQNYCFSGVEVFIAALIVAITSVFVFLFSLSISSSRFLALLITFVFAFCSPVWSTASRALWSHGPSILMLSMVVWGLFKAKEKEAWLFLVAICLSYSYVIRPTNCIPVVFISLYVLLEHRKYLWLYALGLAVVFIPWIAYNYHIYHHILSNYYTPKPTTVGANKNLSEGMIGTLFSPGRGLFIFTPVVFFSFIGAGVKLWNKTFNRLDFFVLMILLAHYYLISSFSTPFGGWCFGPRYFTDMMPFFAYFLIYFVMDVNAVRPPFVQLFLLLTFSLSVAVSFYINYRGATKPATFAWNAEPNNIDEHMERLWDWSDLQFLRR